MSPLSYVNKLDAKGSCSENGYRSEARFKRILNSYRNDIALRDAYRSLLYSIASAGIDIRCFLCELREATEQEQFNHIDFYLGTVGIDIKAIKRLNRSDIIQNPDMVWMEIRGSNNKLGWIYSHHTNIFAFEYLEGFYLLTPSQCQFIAEKYQKYTDIPTIGFRYTRKSDNSILLSAPIKELHIGIKLVDPIVLHTLEMQTSQTLDALLLKKKKTG